MGKNKKDSTSVHRQSYGRVPGTGDLLGKVHKTTVDRGGEEYSGYGSTSREADKNAGDKARRGKKR